MNFLKQKLLFFITLVLAVNFLAFVPVVSEARGLVPCGGYADDLGTPEPPCKFMDIFTLIARVTNWLIGMSGVLAVYNIIGAGWWLVISQGNEEAISQNKKAITNSVVGLVLVMMAYMLINTVVNYMLVMQKPGYKVDLSNPTCYLSPTTHNSCFVQADKSK